MQTKQNFLLYSVKLTEYVYSALSVCSNPCVGPLPKIKISFFLLSSCTEELKSTGKIITFLPNPIPGNEKLYQIQFHIQDTLPIDISIFIF